ncbi:MAG: AhpC/TSA family protein [Sphingobacteriaceae bacterium]|nr:AhpC/TSA family protein [Sphingobacteriaceae bacterium]
MMIRSAKLQLSIFISILCSLSFAQSGYDIRFNMKGNKDTIMYLVKYVWDQQYIADTCKNIKNGQVVFKGKEDLDKGVYVLVSQSKSIYFDVFVNENQKFTITCDNSDIVTTLKVTGNKENETFFSYIKYITGKNQEFGKFQAQTKGMNKADSIKFMLDKINLMNADVMKFEKDFMESTKGTYVNDVMNLKTEKNPTDIPKASNGRPDSVYQYYWYKSHFFDGIDFTDDRIIRTPFFDDRVKRYFESVILQAPDTMIQEIDKILAKCKPDGLVYNFEIYMIDTIHGREVLKMGFDTAKTSESITKLYYKNLDKLTPWFKTVYGISAKYTVLVFWSVDCGHCQTEIPKLNDTLKTLKGKIDYKVLSVYTKEDFEAWRKFIIDKKLDFINVFDPVHINDLKNKYDIYSTPVIYILDKDKKIKAKRLGSEQVIDMLKFFEKNDQK